MGRYWPEEKFSYGSVHTCTVATRTMGERNENKEIERVLANGGPAHIMQEAGRRGSRARPGNTAKPPGSEMSFSDVCVDAGGKRILWSVSGKAVPGQMLAIMGPSGKLYTLLWY